MVENKPAGSWLQLQQGGISSGGWSHGGREWEWEAAELSTKDSPHSWSRAPPSSKDYLGSGVVSRSVNYLPAELWKVLEKC